MKIPDFGRLPALKGSKILWMKLFTNLLQRLQK